MGPGRQGRDVHFGPDRSGPTWTASRSTPTRDLDADARIALTYYSLVPDTLAAEIYPFLGTSRLAEVVDRHGADLVLHGHAHNGRPNGATTTGIPVHNVAITLLQSQDPPAVYRVFDV